MLKIKYRYVTLTVLSLVSFIVHSTSVFAAPSADLQPFYNSNDILWYDPNPDDPSITCSASGGTITSLSGKDNEEKIWNYLTAAGLSGKQAAGILGNITTESGHTFSPTISEFGKTFGHWGYGLIQWTNYKDGPDGRRTNLINSLKKNVPDLMSKYYNVNYSTLGSGIGSKDSSYTSSEDGYIPKNASTNNSMGESDNDAFLSAELDFMVTEAKNRPLSSSSIPHIDSGDYKGSSEWEALLKQQSTTSASNLWVYSNEVPADLDSTAVVRAGYADTVYSTYSTAKSGAECSTPTDTNQSKQALAKQILASGNVSFWGTQNATKKILTGLSDGSNDGNAFPCGINLNILEMIAAITKDHKISINDSNRACSNSTAGGASTTRSRHYAGNGSAVDFGNIDGISPYTVKGANLILSIIKPYLVDQSSVGQLTDIPGYNRCALPSSVLDLPTGIHINRFADACTHLHIDVPPDVDPNLKCKKPVNYGGCENT